MKAVWFEKGLRGVREVPEPVPGLGEVVVDVHAVGICNTDLELARGYMGFTGVPGHEFVGWVRADGHPWNGRRVVGEINIGCGECAACRSGWTRHCAEREVLGILRRQGAFAPRIVMPVSNLYLVPDALSDHDAVFVEPVAAAIRIFEQFHVEPGERVLLVGDGKLAQLIARVAAVFGVRLSVCAKHERKAELIAPFAREVVRDPNHRWPEPFRYVIEASGSPAGLSTARANTAPRGTIILKSTYAGRADLDWSMIVVDEIAVIGSRCGPFVPAMDLLDRGFVDPRPLVDAVYPFESVVEAFERAQTPGTLKVIVEFPPQ